MLKDDFRKFIDFRVDNVLQDLLCDKNYLKIIDEIDNFELAHIESSIILDDYNEKLKARTYFELPAMYKRGFLDALKLTNF